MTRLPPLAIFVAGFALAVIMQITVVASFGGLGALLQVGEDSLTTPFIQAELGEVPTFPALGHDGQSSYIIARQPFGGDAAELLERPGFRYRRWLYPALAGGVGTLAPRATVIGLAFWSAFGFGLSAAGLVLLAETYRVRTRLVALGIFLNVGLMLSTMISTSDALGMGFSLMALTAYRKRRPVVAIALLVAATVTKEQFFIFGIAMAIDAVMSGRRKEGGFIFFVPLGVLVAITILLGSVFGGSGGVGSNVTWPFSGIVSAASGWFDLTPFSRQAAYATLVGMTALIPIALWARDRLIVLMSAGWVAGGILAGEVVWRKGTDAIRVVGAIWPLLALAIAVGIVRSRAKVKTLPG